MNDVRAAARGLRHLAAGELTARHVVRVGHDTRAANRVLRHETGRERESVERDVVALRRLAGHAEVGGTTAARAVRTGQHDTRCERGDGRRVGGIDGQACRLATIDHALGAARGRRAATGTLLRGPARTAHLDTRQRLRRVLAERDVAHDAIIIAIARDGQRRGLKTDVAHREAIRAAAIGKQDRVFALRIRALAARDLRLGGLRLDLRILDRGTSRALDHARDDVSGGTDLGGQRQRHGDEREQRNNETAQSARRIQARHHKSTIGRAEGTTEVLHIQTGSRKSASGRALSTRSTPPVFPALA